MLNQQQCERILAIMTNHTVEEKLKGIEDAKVLFTAAFKPEMTDVQFAYSAMVIEQQYNYIREILQVKQIRIKADLTGHVIKEKNKANKAATKKAKGVAAAPDMSQLMAAFANYKPKEVKAIEGSTTPISNPFKEGTKS